MTFKIVLGMGAGFAVGLLLNWIGVSGWIAAIVVDGLLHVGGSFWPA